MNPLQQLERPHSKLLLIVTQLYSSNKIDQHCKTLLKSKFPILKLTLNVVAIVKDDKHLLDALSHFENDVQSLKDHVC